MSDMKYCNLDPRGKRRIALTFDVDWAPDFAIESMLGLLGDVKATIFFTHPTPMIAEIRKRYPNVELGYHPNFFPGTTQGADEAEILDFGRKMLGRFKGIRSHCLLNSSKHYELYARRGIRHDSSLIMFKVPYLIPYLDEHRILRMPIFWEDDTNADSGADWDDLEILLRMPGLKIFNFHPLYLYMDLKTMERYLSFKKRIQSKALPLNRCSMEDVERYRHKGGRYNLHFFKSLLSKITDGGVIPYRLNDYGL